ncbi:MAG: helix-turn-helix domain-containing protein [Candidatus Woykebacteria bacterium]
MRTVGEILIEAREKKNLSLEQAEKDTRIRKSVLKHLEEGNWSSLAPTYTKGLLKNYANYLGLDERRVLAFFRREYDEKKQLHLPKKTEKIQPKLRLSPPLLTAALISGLVLIVGLYLFSQYRSFTAAPFLEVEEPKNNTKISSDEVNVVGKTLNDSILKVNGEQVQVSPGGSFSITVGLREGVNSLTITSANRFGKITTVKRTVVAETGEKESNSGEEDEPLNLELKIARRSTFLTIEIDGKPTFKGLMLADSKKKFQAAEKIKIIAEDAGLVSVNFGGKEFTLGKEGEKVEREFTRLDLP